MEKVTIQEASRRLNVSQRDIREYIRNGRLKAERDPNSATGRWLVEMPEDGWEDDFKSFLNVMSAGQTPWWWAFEAKTGKVHYLLQVGIEEIMPDFLCGLRGENLYPAYGHAPGQRCPNCLREAVGQGLPLWDEE
jgi:hypothetical protein